MSSFTPREIVSELDRYIVGQDDAKRAVAIALRNRWRRQRLTDELRDELVPLNRRYPIADLLNACRAFNGLSNARRITGWSSG